MLDLKNLIVAIWAGFGVTCAIRKMIKKLAAAFHQLWSRYEEKSNLKIVDHNAHLYLTFLSWPVSHPA